MQYIYATDFLVLSMQHLIEKSTYNLRFLPS